MSRNLALEHAAPDIDEASIAHPRGTGGFATAAGEAAIEVQLSFSADLVTLEHLLDEIDTAARPVELVAQQLIGRTRRRAKTAMHAGAQDRIGFAAFRRIANERREIRFHQTSGYSRPRFRMRCGSNVALSR